MGKSKITHAKRYLLNLLAERKLNAWCKERNLPHTTIYTLAAEDLPPTYSIICKLLPYIEPAKWFYSEDEEIPYKMRLLPEWNPDDVSYFVRKHRYDYKDLISKYDLSDSTALNLFVNYRTKPSIMMIKKACAEVNPEEFFIEGDVNEDGKFYPDRGDIVSISGKTMLVLSKEKINRKNKLFIGVEIENNVLNLQTMTTVTYIRSNPELIGKAEADFVENALKDVKALLK
ncbi:hypothetical protein [Treponema sp.]|uniref:hypothetical protein n=1 Tax=Treponema sp. TaxID=166 RepID=UPI00298DF649|nr:hypothetical protein [Treponema sp.]MCQ2242530.1 hypothetical protein [Treponema sp.]